MCMDVRMGLWGCAMANWKKMKAEYIREKVSYRTLAEKYGVSPSTLYRRMKAEKWADLRKQSEAKANAKIVESVAEKEAKRADVFERITDKLLARIEAGIDDGSLLVNSKGMRDITGAIKDIRDIKGIKSKADEREQEARINKLIKDCETESEDKEIKVVLMDGFEDYAE